jgi:hypothetical protein
VTAPRVGWINAYTIAWEIGDIRRFASPDDDAENDGSKHFPSPCS